MSFLGVHLCAEASKGLRLLRGEVALAGFAFAGSFFMVKAAAVGFLEASIFIVLLVYGRACWDLAVVDVLDIPVGKTC